MADKVNAHGEATDLSKTGINGTNDMKCERFTGGNSGKESSDTHHLTVYIIRTKTPEQRSITTGSSIMTILICRC